MERKNRENQLVIIVRSVIDKDVFTSDAVRAVFDAFHEVAIFRRGFYFKIITGRCIGVAACISSLKQTETRREPSDE